MEEIKKHGETILFKWEESRGRSLRIKISNGEVTLFKPHFMPKILAKRFLFKKWEWIQKSLKKYENFLKKLTKEEKEIFLKKKLNPKSKKEKRKEYLLQKEDARKLVEQKLLFWKKYYYENFSINLEYKRVAIKNSVSRWGSCSSKKNLNFSYKIISLKEEEQDYLIVHELCHLLEMNHGENFWKLVSMGVPKYKDLRKKLRMGIF